MSEVHTFPLITSLFSDTRIPLQYRGGGNTPAPGAIELILLIEYLADQLGLGTAAVSIVTGDTIAVVGGNLIHCLAVEAAVGVRTIKIGTSPGADDLLELTVIPANSDFTVTLNKYTSTTFTMHFTLTGGGASVLVFKQAKS